MSRHDAREREAWRRQISAYIDNELEPELHRRIERELRICRECREYHQQEKALQAQRQGLAWVPPPQRLRRDVFAEAEREDRSWTLVGWQIPGLGTVVTIATLIALAFLVPSIFQLIRPPQTSQQAAERQPSAQPALPTVPVLLAVPQQQPTLAARPVASQQLLPTTQVLTLPAVSRPTPEGVLETVAQPDGAREGEVQITVAAEAGPVGSPAEPRPAALPVAPTPRTPAALIPTPAPSVTPANAVLKVQVGGRVTEVQRAQRLATVREGPIAVTVAFSSDTAIVSDPDGQALTYEQIGIADRVEVTGIPGNAPNTVTALRVSVLNPLVHAQPSPARSTLVHPRGRTAKVLYLQDGVESAPAGTRQQVSTRHWLEQLTARGFNIVPIDPARVAALTLDDVGLVVIGFPATLSPATLGSIQGSAVPVLNGNPLYAPALRLGQHADPANPRRSAPGIAVYVAGHVPLVQDLAGVQAVAVAPMEQVPIVAQGTVLAALDEGGSDSAVWASSGNRMYFGLWPDPAGAAPTALYWTFVNRAVASLLGAQ